MHVLDDPSLSPRVVRFLAERGRRLYAPAGRSTELPPIQFHEPAPEMPAAMPDELIAAVLAFEQRYGGLSYRLGPDRNPHEYGLMGELAVSRIAGHGWAFGGILDGDDTWGLDVLLDGRTTTGPGSWPDRVIDRNPLQRLERHALLTEVADWPHHTSTLASPAIDGPGLPVDVAATGPANLWWYDGEAAVHLTLSGWPATGDVWTLCRFARDPDRLPVVRADIMGRNMQLGKLP